MCGLPSSSGVMLSRGVCGIGWPGRTPLSPGDPGKPLVTVWRELEDRGIGPVSMDIP